MKFTLILIAIAVVCYAIPAIFISDPSELYQNFAFSPENVASSPYVIITSIFLHGSLFHLLSNILVLFFFGMAVEAELGPKNMLIIFLLGAIAGDVFSGFFYPPGTIGIGMSAGVFALVGAGMLVKPLDMSYYPMIIPIPLAFFGLAYALYNAYAFVFNIDPSVSYIGHFGGLIVGLIFGIHKTGMKRGLEIILTTLALLTLIPLLRFFWG